MRIPGFVLIGVFFAVPALAKPAINVGNPASSSNFRTLVQSWGYTPLDCSQSNITLRDRSSNEVVCIAPNADLAPGNYLYDPQRNEIVLDELPPTGEPAPTPRRTPNLDLPGLDQVVFRFRNILEYNDCLDELLLIYEQRLAAIGRVEPITPCGQDVFRIFGTTLSQEQMLALVVLANDRATKLLETAIYPATGIRRRVLLSTGYVYEVDRDNPEIQELLNQRN